ncbi:MAG: ABC transporter ATP-binding protein [Bacteroidota bacterium]
MLSAQNLTKQYGNHTALRDLNLQVNPGEVFCLLGANGAGKTTTINLFMGFLQPTAGTVRINDIDVATRAAETKQHLAYIPENLNLYQNLTGLENLRFFTGLANVSLDDHTATELLHSVGLQAGAIRQRVSTYSKGMRQKVGIAIAKAKRADNLLLDEPTSGLDPQASNDFARLIQDMRGAGVAVLMATHDLFRAKETGTHVGIMRAGVLVHTLATDDIKLNDLERLYLETVWAEPLSAD